MLRQSYVPDFPKWDRDYRHSQFRKKKREEEKCRVGKKGRWLFWKLPGPG